MRPMEDRFWEKVDRGHPLDCWEWQAYIHPLGYGRFNKAKGVYDWAHRVAYELLRGPIPPDLECDHLCEDKACVNPWHIELVTHQENTARRSASCRRSLMTPAMLEVLEDVDV